ncbi:MAG: thioesterase family protein, partial [Deltaproteobacteria bacterium]
MQTLPLSQAIAITPRGPGSWTAEVSPDWAQGRAVFGGVVSGLGLAALDRLRPADRPVRLVVVEFLAPLTPGPVHIDGVVLRSGRSLTHARITLTQGEQPAAIILASCGRPRPSRIAVPPATDAPRP